MNTITINRNKYLNIKLSNILSNEIETYIGNCIDTGDLDYNKKINIEDESTRHNTRGYHQRSRTMG